MRAEPRFAHLCEGVRAQDETEGEKQGGRTLRCGRLESYVRGKRRGYARICFTAFRDRVSPGSP